MSAIHSTALPVGKAHPFDGEQPLKNFLSLIATESDARFLGIDEKVQAIFSRFGFEPTETPAASITLSKHRITAVCIPHAIATSKESMRQLREARRHAKANGHNVLLLPQAIIERQPRLKNAELIASSLSMSPDPTSRMLVLCHLLETGSATIGECASLIDSTQPYQGVLAMVANGEVDIDLNEEITPYSLVHAVAGVRQTDLNWQ